MTAYAGFDRSDYPGRAVMDWLKANTNLRWCAFYLPSPSHPDRSWIEAPAADFAGWGRAPVYVGQQVTGPGSHNVTAAQGALDGADACKLMGAAGWTAGSRVWLDLENGPPLTDVQRGYVGAWCDAVAAAGFKPGVYCSFLMAAEVKGLRPNASVWAFHVRTVSPHEVPALNFPTPDPATSGFAGADIWQLDDEAMLLCPLAAGGELVVDLDSANSADPSAAVSAQV